jgi:tRNA threonylcarbamoyladenosine biosynthesis protein TsaE
MRRPAAGTVPARELATTSPEATEALGEALGRAAPRGTLIGLVGDLGAGKTCLVRGLARGLGVPGERVHSPSFTIVNEYRGGRLALHHVDLYRLEAPLTDTLFLRDVLYGEGVAAVEWFDRLLPAAGDDVLLVTLAYDEAGADRRVVRLEATGPRHERLLHDALGEG